MYVVTKRAKAGMKRWHPALVKVNDNVIVIGGKEKITETNLKTVACYDLANNAWSSNLPQLNKDRHSASACVLGAYVYVFAGCSNISELNSIEKIGISSLF